MEACVNSALVVCLRALEEEFRRDPRCAGIYLWGSAGRGEEDAWSDLDLAVVVREGDYEAVREEARGTCERLCGRIVGWLPEGEAPGFCNFACLIEAGENVLLCDLLLLTARELARRRIRPGRILFDPEGSLREAGQQGPEPGLAAGDLESAIRTYWIYMYLNGKYLRRGDLFKLLYVQGVLFQQHVRVLNGLQPERRWIWWADDVKRLPEETRAELLVYFGATDVKGLRAAIEREAELFSRTAAAGCDALGIDYPHSLEAAVRGHLGLRPRA